MCVFDVSLGTTLNSYQSSCLRSIRFCPCVFCLVYFLVMQPALFPGISSLLNASTTVPPMLSVTGVSEEVFNVISTVEVSEGSPIPSTGLFSILSDFHHIATICVEQVPGWSSLVTNVTSDIEVKQLLEGLSNQLFKVTLKPSTSTGSALPFGTVLFRIYGEHVSSFYDPAFELEVFTGLSQLRIGPKMIASGEGWRIEEYYESVVLKTSSLPSPSIYTQVAAQLGRLHKIHRNEKFLANHDKETPISFERLSRWSEEGLTALDRLPNSAAKREALRIDEIIAEVAAMRARLEHGFVGGAGGRRQIGWDIVFCHNDLQENNILLTPQGLIFIDFEYANFNFQSADIGNFFDEFTMDYIHGEWPFFKFDREDYPSEEIQRQFASVYLSEYLDRPIYESRDGALITELLDSVHVFSQLSHLLWGLWSLVRAQQQTETFNSFDFVEYARFRFESYWANKRD